MNPLILNLLLPQLYSTIIVSVMRSVLNSPETRLEPMYEPECQYNTSNRLLQSNLSSVDTKETEQSVLIRKVSIHLSQN